MKPPLRIPADDDRWRALAKRHSTPSHTSVTICSGLYLFVGIPAFLQSEFSLTAAGTKIPGHVTSFASLVHAANFQIVDNLLMELRILFCTRRAPVHV